MPVDGVNSAHFAIGPVVAIVVVCVLAVLSKWIFGSGRRRTPAAPLPPGVQIDTGLLRPIAELPDRGAAGAVRAVLSDAGIRSTVGVRGDGRVQVLVFPADEDRARRLVPDARPGEVT